MLWFGLLHYLMTQLTGFMERIISLVRQRFKHTSWNPDDVDGLHGLRLTLDEPADYQCIRTLLEVLKPQTVTFPIRVLEDIIKALPDMRLINAHVQQKHVAQG